MADHPLIAGYIATLGDRLPAEAVDELADGLNETFQHHLRRGLTRSDAAAAAIAEFGRPDLVIAAFTRHSAGRRTAVRLLATAPVFAALWGTTLISAHAWTWPIPPGAAVAFGVTLLTVATALVVVAASNNPERTRLAGPASLVVILLDLAMLTAVAAAAPALTWPMALAVPASLARIALTARNLPRAIAP